MGRVSDEYGVYYRPELVGPGTARPEAMLARRLGSMVLSIGLVAPPGTGPGRTSSRIGVPG